MQRLRILDRLGARAHVGLGDDLEQRRAGAVQVDAGPVAGEVERRALRRGRVVFGSGDAVDRLAGVFFQVGACQVDAMELIADEELERAALHHRRLVLADLVALGQVGIEVVLAREDRQRRDRGVDREPEPDRRRRGWRPAACRAGPGRRPRPACSAPRRRRSRRR